PGGPCRASRSRAARSASADRTSLAPPTHRTLGPPSTSHEAKQRFGSGDLLSSGGQIGTRGESAAACREPRADQKLQAPEKAVPGILRPGTYALALGDGVPVRGATMGVYPLTCV